MSIVYQSAVSVCGSCNSSENEAKSYLKTAPTCCTINGSKCSGSSVLMETRSESVCMIRQSAYSSGVLVRGGVHRW